MLSKPQPSKTNHVYCYYYHHCLCCYCYCWPNYYPCLHPHKAQQQIDDKQSAYYAPTTRSPTWGGPT